MLTFRSSLAILTNYNLTLYRMAHTKLTPRKMTGPKGVPGHQLAPRNDDASSNRSNPQAKIERLSTKLAQATRDRASDAIHVGELQGQLRRLTRAHLSCERMMGHLVEERNEAWHREDVARDRVEELEFYVNDLEGDNQILHEEVHQLYYQLHPPPGAAELDPGVILVDGGES
jgi:hypothetical protein